MIVLEAPPITSGARSRFPALLLAALSLTGVAGCRRDSTASPIPARVDAARFVDVAEAAGLRYRWTIPGKRPLNILRSIGCGCAFLDYDNDGSLDVLLVGRKPAL